MKRNFTLVLCLAILSISQSQTTYVDNGSATIYTLQNGDSLYISQGVFTGKINDWSGGGKITVASGAVFNPSSVNGYHSKYVVYGTAVLPSFQTSGGFGLENYGAITINGNAEMNGGAQTWTNANNATIHFTGSVALNANGSRFINYGQMIIGKDFSAYSDVSIINRKDVLIGEDFAIGNGQLQNEGYWYAQKSITLNKNATVTNTCRLVSGKSITINSAIVYNSGLIWASNGQNASAFTNNGTVISTDRGIIKSVKFTNNGTVKGNGFLYLTGKTIGGGTIGTNGYTTDTLKVYSVNRSKTTQIFDDQWGTVHPNTIYARFNAPDTATASNYPCYAESAAIILPVVWNDFSVKLFNNTPVLSWSAEYDYGTLFEVQRSYNGKGFFAVVAMKQQHDKSYQYNDQEMADNHPTVIYYRIKAIEPNGTEKYSDIKMIRFNVVSNTTLAASPNPFTSVLNISYQSSKKGVVTVNVLNLQGQSQLVKKITVTNGNNSIAIAEAARLKKGIYIIHFSADNGVVQSVKLIKQ